MKNNLYYNALKDYILANDFTAEQVEALDHRQAAALIECSAQDLPNIDNVKRALGMSVALRDREINCQFFTAQFSGNKRVAVKNKWPDGEVTKEQMDGKHVFVFWPEGK